MANDNLGRELAALGRARVYFGHQSIGDDIVRGLRLLVKEAGTSSLTITRLGASPIPTGPAVLDSLVGENTRPETKLRDFEQTLDALARHPIDVALLKFCYVDISADSNVERIFEQYRRLLSRLHSRYPRTSFVPVTVPLVRGESLKNGITRWLRGGPDPNPQNVRRNEYNDILRAHYRRDPLFDVAKVESAGPDGRSRRFRPDGRRFEQLSASLTMDGGHLNEVGSVAAARELVHVLAGVLAGRATANASAPLPADPATPADLNDRAQKPCVASPV